MGFGETLRELSMCPLDMSVRGALCLPHSCKIYYLKNCLVIEERKVSMLESARTASFFSLNDLRVFYEPETGSFAKKEC